ncbi:MAG: molybdopterin-synthase adenylyltransferase MoeB [Acidiferrobacteraceae bacterium]|nr:molybdopterin-synthase adenylyltransferase MoeB [Acidiferrobacteraceae bacterium]
MNQEEKDRYSRQIKLQQVGEEGQQRLLMSRVLIVGMGGLGSPVAMYLAAAGVGNLVLTDYDHVDVSNLQRQIVHTHADIGELKAISARQTLISLNPNVNVTAFDYELDDSELLEQTTLADVLVDCTDNFTSRFALNRASIATDTPLISGAAIRWEGLVSTFLPTIESSPCYQCLYPDTGIEAATCAMEGVIAPIVGVIGTMQALEVVNVLLKAGEGLNGRILALDGLTMEWENITLPKDPNCPACSKQH